jgi:hypothetical protein
VLQSDERRVAAQRFLDTDTIAQALQWDRAHASSAIDEIHVAVRTPWPELGRSSRAFILVDREIRRCATAMRLALEEAEESLDASVFTSTRRFEDHLRAFPIPIHESKGSLRLQVTQGPPFTALLTPVDAVWTVLASWPVATLAYAISAFETRFSMALHDYCKLEAATYAASDEIRLEAIVSAGHNQWHGSATGRMRTITESFDGPSSRFRPIGDYHDNEESRPEHGVEVVLLRTISDGYQELVSVGTVPV